MSSSSQPQDVRRFIEDFGLVMANAGMQRMAARTFAALLISETDGLTAREIADMLQVSPAAVSGAVRYLENVKLLDRRRDPGRRTDHYEISNETWYHAMAKNESLEAMITSLEAGVAALPADSAAGARLTEIHDFFAYLQAELPRLVDRWRESRGL